MCLGARARGLWGSLFGPSMKRGKKDDATAPVLGYPSPESKAALQVIVLVSQGAVGSEEVGRRFCWSNPQASKMYMASFCPHFLYSAPPSAPPL